MGYRVVIADDETKIIQLIEKLGRWRELDIEILDTCSSGRQAYESIVRNRPDFVLSDIKMPGMDGLELIQKVREAGLHPLFILISGYRHFEYARTAVALNVMDYLLKPIDEVQLNETLSRVCRRIDELRNQQEDTREAALYRDALGREQSERFFHDLIYKDFGTMNRIAYSEENCNREYGTSFVPGCYQVIFIYTNLSAVIGGSASVSSDKLQKCMEESFPPETVICSTTSFRGTVMVLNFKEDQRKRNRQAVDAFYYSVRNLSELFGNFKLHIGVSDVCSGIAGLRKAADEAHAAEWGRLVLTRDSVLDYARIRDLPGFSPEEVITAAQRKQAADCIRYMRKEELGAVFSEICERAGRVTNRAPGCMMKTFFELGNALDAAVAEQERQSFQESFYYAYMNGSNFRNVMKNVFLMLDQYIDEHRNRAREKKSRPSAAAVRWIREHYGEPLSLEEVAEQADVSAKYLSRIFKEEMDIGFLEYLTQVRMEEAEKLLADSALSIKEIALRVGYPDEKYFSKIFKKSTGMKPTEYRRIYG